MKEINFRAYLNEENNRNDATLRKACLNGDIRKVKRLIKSGTNVNAKGINDYTPLYFACRTGNMEIIKLLMDNGAKDSVNVVADQGNSPMMWAEEYKNKEMMDLLTKKQ